LIAGGPIPFEAAALYASWAAITGAATAATVSQERGGAPQSSTSTPSASTTIEASKA